MQNYNPNRTFVINEGKQSDPKKLTPEMLAQGKLAREIETISNDKRDKYKEVWE